MGGFVVAIYCGITAASSICLACLFCCSVWVSMAKSHHDGIASSADTPPPPLDFRHNPAEFHPNHLYETPDNTRNACFESSTKHLSNSLRISQRRFPPQTPIVCRPTWLIFVDTSISALFVSKGESGGLLIISA